MKTNVKKIKKNEKLYLHYPGIEPGSKTWNTKIIRKRSSDAKIAIFEQQFKLPRRLYEIKP